MWVAILVVISLAGLIAFLDYRTAQRFRDIHRAGNLFGKEDDK